MPQRSSGARSDWYDRNVTGASLFYDAINVAPHLLTNRGAYTVPVQRKAIIQGAFIREIVSAAPSTAGNRKAFIRVTANSINTFLCYALLDVSLIVVGNRNEMLIGRSAVLSTGDIVNMFTQDTAVDGSVDYTLSATMSEFDA